MSKDLYFLLGLIILVAVLIIVDNKVCFGNREKRDKKYIKELFNDVYYGEPCPTREILAQEIYGDGYEQDAAALEMINDNVDPIKDFLSNGRGKKTLCINGKWGSGKTTSLLIAIDEVQNEENRYIYESVFKYQNNMDEFNRDLFNALKGVMSEIGIRYYKIDFSVDSLMNNFDSSFKGTVINSVRNYFKFDVLSSDFILRINKQYNKNSTANNKMIYIIIDDLDRMKGKDITNVLSVLSVLRRIRFVQIIVLADLEILQQSLEKYDVVDAPRFIEKYLPSQMSHVVYSGYDVVEKILLDKIACKLGKQGQPNVEKFRPTMAAILISMLAKKLYDETRNFSNTRYPWLKSSSFDGQIIFKENEKNKDNDIIAQLVLSAPKVMRNAIDIESDYQSVRSDSKYKWDGKYNSIRTFQNIIYALKKKNGDSYIPVKSIFSDEIYDDIIESWIFEYIKKRWDIFGFTMRDALNILEKINYQKMKYNKADQFVYIFNQLFPKNKLEVFESS